MLVALALFACSAPDTPEDEGTDLNTDLTETTEPVDCDEGTKVGDCAPDFTLPDRDGNMVSLSDYEGDLILVNCSAMW